MKSTLQQSASPQDRIQNVLDYLDFDESILSHLEATYHSKLAATATVTAEPIQAEHVPNEKDMLEKYNNWRRDHLATATVAEKLKWNQYRRSILEKGRENPLIQEAQPSLPTTVPHSNSSTTQELHKLWTEIVNYRAQISLANNIRDILGEGDTARGTQPGGHSLSP